MIITNFKTYKSATGKKAVELARIHEKAAKDSGKKIMVAVQAIDIAQVVQAVAIPVLAQHIDPVVYGSYTGYLLPESAKEAGAYGTILNHSEHRISRIVLEESILRAKEVGLKTIVCAITPDEAASFLEFEPDFIAVEPPELIGGDISVAFAEPDIIQKSAELIGPKKLLVGAGVKKHEDVQIAVKLGAKGVLLASGVTKAEDPYAVLMDLAGGLK